MPKGESRSDSSRQDSKWQVSDDNLDIILGIGAIKTVNSWKQGYTEFKERCDNEREERQERTRQRKSQCKDKTFEKYLESECKLAPYRAEWNQAFGDDEDEPKVRISNKKYKTNATHSEEDQQHINFNRKKNKKGDAEKCTIS